MDASFYLIQFLNGIQYGFLLFLVAAGLTLVFGIMGIINLAHGSFYMIGAYLAFWLTNLTGNFLIGVALAIPVTIGIGYLVERTTFSRLYSRGHLHQVLLTYALILIFDELQLILWGNDFHGIDVPEFLSGAIQLTDILSYPTYRLFISAICIVLAFMMYWVIQKTKLGMMIRAGASNREMVQILGIDVQRLFAIIFSLGVALAALAGMLAAPVTSVYPGMGENILIISFVVAVIGGIGSIKGAFVGALLVGLVDIYGKTLFPELASILVYALMVVVLLWRPQGLFGTAA
ncbi:MAG: branched-chain amino acid ABC transporter permease [SAR324 cluster bacterium]|nr:branched-chain amino acid ABC transporter permease [SAR324 cluster bacterium]